MYTPSEEMLSLSRRIRHECARKLWLLLVIGKQFLFFRIKPIKCQETKATKFIIYVGYIKYIIGLYNI